jgi:tryptophanyl-tRNA synthetase
MSEGQEKKKVILSGIQPTGTFTLGNYIGAIRNWVTLQEEYDCAYMIADLHSLTVRQEPAKLRQQILRAFAVLLACGVDPQKSLMFIQSHVHQHAELNWVLACNTQFGELSRMTQFKDKSAKHPENVNAGLFTYPSLMAADILLYQADLVPVGVDQKQHLEITRDIANRFNNNYGVTFTIPEPYIPEIGAKVMSLADPTKKMSKSDENQNAFVTILDDKDTIIRKFKRAVTDSDSEIRYAEGKDGINNLMSIYSAISGDSYSAIEKEFAGKGYGEFKLAVGELVADELRPIRESFERLIGDKAYLESVYREGAQKAGYLAEKTMRKVYRKVGLVAK